MESNIFLTLEKFAESLEIGDQISLLNGTIIKLVSKPYLSEGEYYFDGHKGDGKVTTFSLSNLWFYNRIKFQVGTVCFNDSDECKQITNQELFDEMDKYCQDESSKYFYHYTYYGNLVSIIKTGHFYSRNYCKKNGIKIVYDNTKINFTSKSVIENNKSSLTENFVRFYLRLDNAAIRSQRRNDYKINLLYKKCVILINRNALADAEKKTYLSKTNACYLTSEFFEKEPALNVGINKKYPCDLDSFNFKKIYGEYDDSQYGIMKQCAEFLVEESLPIKYIEAIYFGTEEYLAKFLYSIKGILNYNEIRRKCAVNTEYFKRND